MDIFLVDKKAGLTSAEASKLCCPDAGHAGTLDRHASGLLLVFCGEARKLVPLAMGLDKEYEGIIHIHQPTPKKRIQEEIRNFTGDITQTPPVKAAVARLPRTRMVYSFQLLSLDGKDISFRLSCQAGTYVRKIASDLGQALGCGAHLKALRRTRIGPFSAAGRLTGKEFVGRLPVGKVWVKAEALQKVRCGQPLEKGDLLMEEKGSPVVVFAGEKVIALGTKEHGKIRIGRVLRVEPILG